MPRMTTFVPPVKGLAAALLAWLGLFLGATAFVETSAVRLLPPVLAALVALVALWRPFPLAGVPLAVLAAVLAGGLRYLEEGPTGLLAPTVVVLVGLVATALIADALARLTETEERVRRRDERLIEELTPTSGQTGTLKWTHAARQLVDEIVRARRYRYQVSVALVNVDGWGEVVERRGAEGARTVLGEVAQALGECLRPTDTVAQVGEGKLLAILPHTPAEGAVIALDRFRNRVAQAQSVNARIGLAEFPGEAASAEELIREAEAALTFARTAGVSIASRAVLEG